MGRHKLPTQLKVVKGTAQACRINESEPVPVNPLEAAPDYLRVVEKKAFMYLHSKIPDGVAFDSDEPMLALAAQLWVLVRRNKATSAQGSQLQSILARFGLSPADRQKVSTKPKATTDGWDDL
jgi:hypothetical protein